MQPKGCRFPTCPKWKYWQQQSQLFLHAKHVFVMPSTDNGGKNCGKLFWFIQTRTLKFHVGLVLYYLRRTKCFQIEIDDLLGFSVFRQLLVQISVFFTSVINISFHGFSQRRLLGSAYTKEDYSVCQDASIHNRLYLRPEYKYLPLKEVFFVQNISLSIA